MEQGFIDTINKYWAVMAFIVGIIGTWIVSKRQIGEHETRINKIEEKILKLDQKIEERMDAFDRTSNEIKVRLAEIQTTLKYIEQKITK